MFDWSDFLTFAKDVLKSKNDEASLRSAISRTYYSTFHASKDFCHDFAARYSIVIPPYVTNSHGDKEKADHVRIIAALKTNQNFDVQQLGSHLASLKYKRIHADYNATPFPRNTTKVASDAVLEAEATIGKLQILTKP